MKTADETVMIIGRDNNTATEQILFCGVMESLELAEEGGYAVIRLKTVSHI